MINGITPSAIYGVGGQTPMTESFGANGAHFSFKLPKAPEHIVPVSPQDVSVNQISEPTTWGQMLQRMAMDTNEVQNVAGEKIRDVLVGGSTPIHEAMVSMQEANVRFALLAEVRNKVVETYKEIMHMQV
ncbi:MAG: flagellar hook-basal body complex protein FliE [Verrucomicrobiota bacterium]